MKNFDICLHGNLIFDKVYVVDGFRENDSNTPKSIYKSPGALMNMVRSMLTFDWDVSIAIDSCVGNDSSGEYIRRWLDNARKLNGNKIVDNLDTLFTKTSEAVIISDMSKNNRSSIVNWGACSKMEKVKDMGARWDHILYLDKLPNLRSLPFERGGRWTSADVCSSNHDDRTKSRILNMLRKVDFFFASEEEAMSLSSTKSPIDAVRELGKINPIGYAIVHSPKGSLLCGRDGEIHEYKCKNIIKSPADVLGAGDHFASSFIAHRLKNPRSYYQDSIEFAHKSATKFVQDKTISKESIND